MSRWIKLGRLFTGLQFILIIWFHGILLCEDYKVVEGTFKINIWVAKSNSIWHQHTKIRYRLSDAKATRVGIESLLWAERDAFKFRKEGETDGIKENVTRFEIAAQRIRTFKVKRAGRENQFRRENWKDNSNDMESIESNSLSL